MKYKNIESSQITMVELMLPSHSNFSGKIHGGHILNLMDQVAFACASKHSGQYCVTASVNRVDFLHPIQVGELVSLKASVNYTGRTSMVVGLRVESENIKTGDVKHCNSSYFTMVAKDDDGKSVAVPGLILDSEESVRRFMRSITRQAQAKTRSKAFEPNQFVMSDHMELLKNQNAKVNFKK
ncbi:acyl-CoA thioesterase [Roseivirga sp. E12]|uniref:acyl-CoA thioesterase n=1 Tax=Roseivirga sp. E12 TaxID=2819237 RepID=UPI001ABC5B85|nr:acyl-CoA thioesterase [Roseivirga sp. E12]MBO3697450.1 acyl-CoA thioesterase [Roseivirga sp. E12]